MKGEGAKRSARQAIRVPAQLTPRLVNICLVKSGKATKTNRISFLFTQSKQTGPQLLTNSKDASYHGITGQNRGGKDQVGIDEVSQYTEEDEDHSTSERNGSDDRTNPVDMHGYSSPGKDEQTGTAKRGNLAQPQSRLHHLELEGYSRQHEGSDHGSIKSFFRNQPTPLSLKFLAVPRVLDEYHISEREGDSDGDPDESESSDPGRPSSFLLEDDGESGEEHLRRASISNQVSEESTRNPKERSRDSRKGWRK